jgi:Arc/MetJ-type ribon-helix-helix transcriptional regulator
MTSVLASKKNLVMTKAEVLEALKKMTTEERLEVIEIASKLIREEITTKSKVPLQKELSLAEAAEVMRSFYEQGSEVVRNMNVEKLSISLPPSLVEFIENYKLNKGCKSRSQVIEEALELLRNQELEEAYRQASAEVDSDWDVTVADGLTDKLNDDFLTQMSV